MNLVGMGSSGRVYGPRAWLHTWSPGLAFCGPEAAVGKSHRQTQPGALSAVGDGARG